MKTSLLFIAIFGLMSNQAALSEIHMSTDYSAKIISVISEVHLYEYPESIRKDRLDQSLTRLSSTIQTLKSYFAGGAPGGCSVYSEEEQILYTELDNLLLQVQGLEGRILTTKTVQGLWSKLFLLIPQLATATDITDLSKLISWISESSSRCRCILKVTYKLVYKYKDGEVLPDYPMLEIEETYKCSKVANVVTCTIVGTNCCTTPKMDCDASLN